MSSLSQEMEFFIFLLEQYAAYKGVTADQVLKKWDELQLSERINRRYEQYHAEALENAFEEIDRMTAEKSAAR